MTTRPTLITHFRLNDVTAISRAAKNTLSLQLTRAELTVTENKTLCLSFEDATNGIVTNAIKQLSRPAKTDIIIDILDGGMGILSQLNLYGCKLKRANYELDYSLSGPAHWVVEFDVGDFNCTVLPETSAVQTELIF